jgi:hypothetical protein
LQLALASLRARTSEEVTYVLVDEMPSAQVAHALFGRLRDELWELPLTWLVAADERDRASYTEPPADAFWRRALSLGPLTRAASIELLRRRLGGEQLPDSVLGLIADEAAGNPRRLVSLAHEVVVEQQDPEAMVERGRARRQKLETLSEPARRLLAELEAGGPASPSDQGLLKSLGWSRSRASQVFGELDHHGLVRADERPGNGGRPRRVYDLVREPDGKP